MRVMSYRRWLALSLVVAACRGEPPPPPPAPTVAVDSVPAVPVGTPYIPAQCYAKTESSGGPAHNPCFTCHADTLAPNYLKDGELQLGYAFGPPALTNPWTNLFADRTRQVEAMADADIQAYVRHDNYAGSARKPGLAARLATPGPLDVDGDGVWSGWVPDIAFRFDDGGFDRTADGGYTGWRAYGYYPVPGMFWPTNGSFGDALVRLAPAFREDGSGRFDRAIYGANLAIVEALIARRDVAIEPTAEKAVGVDLDGDGALRTARLVRYRWTPGGGGMRFAGRAGDLQDRGEVHLAAGLFPEGTELAHSLRYLDVQDGRVTMAARMKELRYMTKRSWLSYGRLEQQAAVEAREKERQPMTVRHVIGNRERGIGNRSGWTMTGFIEDAAGELRPQELAELGFCIGCHSGVGATDDSVFSFGRKVPSDGFQRGWYHGSQRGLEGLAEPKRADGRGEYAFYLEQNRAGDDLRANTEVLTRFFDERGAPRPDMVERIASDVSVLLLPSPARALLLDKAYRVIVQEQSFVRGRDATVTPAVHVHRQLPEDELATGVTEPVLDRRRARTAAR
jgi:hypothetical protein